MLLSFEDKSGKFWKFRYSYWNSSQSYVLTKGWSSYVKDKHLDVGDVVFFQTEPRGEASFPSAVSVVSQEARVNTTAAYWNCLATPYRQAPTAVTGSSRTVRLLAVLECHGDVVEPPPCTDRRLLPPHLLLRVVNMMMKKKSERRNLPVWGQKEEFLRTFKENQMVMVTGETGSGKTTQIPQLNLQWR
ncbi:hypothetical protein YC2023_038312 [Brassica napus]